MKSYNLLERNLAKALDKFPQLKQTAKSTYQYLNYWYYGERQFKLALHPEVSLVTPQEWAGCDRELTGLFFGYYDKSPWSPDGTQLVYHLIKGNLVEIIICDRAKQTITTVASSRTWSSQQGSMVQWLPEGQSVLFNDAVAGKLVTRIINLTTQQEQILPLPVQTLHPNGKQALSLNYKRLDRLRPEYGYNSAVSNFASDLAYGDDGIWQLDFDSQATKLVVTLQQLMENQPRPEMQNAQHKVNHIMYSPQGDRYVFMHRWLGKDGKYSRLYVADAQHNLTLLLDERMVSHYSWQDETHLIAWARTEKYGDRYHLINVETEAKQVIGQDVLDVFGDGHPSFSPDRRWLITDTYPDKARKQHLLLYELATARIIEIGSFLAPLKYSAARRCDLHPRWSRDGNWISVDATYENKRMSYLLDVSKLIN